MIDADWREMLSRMSLTALEELRGNFKKARFGDLYGTDPARRQDAIDTLGTIFDEIQARKTGQRRTA